MPAGRCNARQLAGQDAEFALQRRANDELAGVMDDRLEVPPAADEFGVDAVHTLLRRGVDEQAVDQVGEAVACGAVDRPVFRQAFVFAENLFDDQVQRQVAPLPAAFIAIPVLAADRARLQATEVLRRIVETVGVVDTQPLHQSLVGQRQHQAVAGLERFGIFHAHRGQIVLVEETAVVDLVGGDAPVGQAVGLRLDQRVQRVEALVVARRAVVGDPAVGAVECGNGLRQMRGDRRHGGAQRGQAPLVHFLVASAFGDLLRRGLVARRQMAERGRQALQLDQRFVAGVERGARTVDGAREDARVFGRIDGQTVPVIVQAELAPLGIEGQRHFAAVERRAVVLAEDRQQHLAAQVRVERLPVDVEITRVGRGWPIFQHILPPAVVGTVDAHVVGHDVEDQPHAVAAQRRGEAPEVLLAADLRIEGVVIDGVVAVAASGPRFQAGRQIAMADAEFGQVRDHLRCLCQREVVVELQAIGGTRDFRRGNIAAGHGEPPAGTGSSIQATDQGGRRPSSSSPAGRFALR